MSNILVNQGTQTPVATDTVGTELYQKIKLDFGAAGASSPFLGTFTINNAGTMQGGTLNNLATGTLNALAAGTITAGTLQNLATGTVNTVGLVSATYWINGVTQTGAGTQALKTSPGAGTRVYATDVILSGASGGGTVTITDGAGGTTIMPNMSVAAGNTIPLPLRSPIFTSTGGTMVMSTTAGTIIITLIGYTAP